MSYKIRRFRSIQACRGIQTDKSWQLQQTVEILKEQIQSLNLELRYKSYELEQVKQSRYTEHELYSIIGSMLLNIDDTNELTKNLLVCDRLIKNVLTELLDAINVYNSLEQE